MENCTQYCFCVAYNKLTHPIPGPSYSPRAPVTQPFPPYLYLGCAFKNSMFERQLKVGFEAQNIEEGGRERGYRHDP